jgi:hypothetical protein
MRLFCFAVATVAALALSGGSAFAQTITILRPYVESPVTPTVTSCPLSVTLAMDISATNWPVPPRPAPGVSVKPAAHTVVYQWSRQDATGGQALSENRTLDFSTGHPTTQTIRQTWVFADGAQEQVRVRIISPMGPNGQQLSRPLIVGVTCPHATGNFSWHVQ